MHHAHHTSRDGFSLIEVLIAVVVLAFGLLGLAAVFPAVVKQQTTAKDAVQGVSVLRSAEEWVLGHTALNEHQTDPTRATNLQLIANRRGWETLVAETTWHADASDERERATWPSLEVIADVRASGVSSVIYGRQSGDVGIGRPFVNGGVTERGVVIPLSQRLFPSPYIDAKARPEYVWDVVARRVDVGLPHTYNGDAAANRNKYEDDAVELVIFVRRIDPGLRVNRTGTYPLAFAISDALLAPEGSAEFRLALAERADGTPTLDGATAGGARYATPKRLDVRFPDATRLDMIAVAGVSGETQGAIVGQAQQVGQALVDTLGTVHYVREVQTRNPVNNNPWPETRLIVEPAFDPQVQRWDANGEAHVVFTTHIPAAVGVVRVDPRKGGRL